MDGEDTVKYTTSMRMVSWVMLNELKEEERKTEEKVVGECQARPQDHADQKLQGESK